MLSDIQIASEAKMLPITEIAKIKIKRVLFFIMPPPFVCPFNIPHRRFCNRCKCRKQRKSLEIST